MPLEFCSTILLDLILEAKTGESTTAFSLEVLVVAGISWIFGVQA